MKHSSAANVEYHARIVLEKAILRRIIAENSKITARAFSPTEDAFDLLDDAEQSIFKISEAELVELLEEAVELTDSAALARPAGAVQLVIGHDPALLATSAVQGYYRRRGMGGGPDARVLAGPMADLAERNEVNA